MNTIQKMLYLRELKKYPRSIPYENLSKFYTYKLQKQGYYHDMTLRSLVTRFLFRRVVSIAKGYYFRLHYYYDQNNDLRNSLVTGVTYNCYVLHVNWYNKKLSLKQK